MRAFVLIVKELAKKTFLKLIGWWIAVIIHCIIWDYVNSVAKQLSVVDKSDMGPRAGS